MPRLILNADDFGLTAGINAAVSRLHGAGVLSSATLMATGPAFDDAVAIAKANPALGVGCHLVFVDGVPVCPPSAIPSLLGPDGRVFRRSVLDFAQSVARGKIASEELVREAQAQIDTLRAAGVEVTHADTHQHVHLLPAVAAAVAEAVARSGVRCVRNPFEPRWSRTVSHASPLRRAELRLAGLLEEPVRKVILTRDSTCMVTDGTLGIAATGRLDVQVLRATLDGLMQCHPDACFELVCHPGRDDADLRRQNTRLLRTREIEVAALLEVIPEYLRIGGGLQLIHYGEAGAEARLRSYATPA